MSLRSPAPKLTVVIVTWNRWDDTEQCLESLKRSSLEPLDFVIIDNASSDGTPAKLQRALPQTTIICNASNVGHTRAVNQGIRAASTEFVVVLDADTTVEPPALEILLDYLKDHREVGIVAPRTFNPDGSIQETARAFPSALNGCFGRKSLLTRAFPGNAISRRYLQSDKLSANTPFLVEQVSGACMMFARDLVEQIGFWDETYFAYWVDTDWCFKAGQAGYQIACIPAAHIIHHEQNRSGTRRSFHRIWHFHYGAYVFYRNGFTFGRLDPRSLFALLALTVHGIWQLVQNLFIAREPTPADVTEVQADR